MRTFLIWLAACASAAAIDLPEDCRVKNRGGNCLWSNCATLGYRHRIPALQALAPRREIIQGPYATDTAVRSKLRAIGVNWQGHDHWTYNREILPQADTRGVIVSIKAGSTWMRGKRTGMLHSVILTSYDEAGVEFYCPDNPQKLWRASAAWFNSSWAGNSIVLQ